MVKALILLSLVYLLANLWAIFSQFAYLRRLWQEPVFRFPIVILESDDWGPAPDWVAKRLVDLAKCLRRHKDVTGAPAKCGLGLVLSAVTGYQKQERCYTFQTRQLSDSQQLLHTIHQGMACNVLFPLLHGQFHFSASVLSKAIGPNSHLQTWLEQPWKTEVLPPAFQSRWIDGNQFPSRQLSNTIVRHQVKQEIQEFKKLFPQFPIIVVPPTFIWDHRCERLWQKQGVAAIMTPGKKLTHRNHLGQPAGSEMNILQGEHHKHVMYLVRDQYFEPSLGHTADNLITALVEKTRVRRATILEMHRANFIASPEEHRRTLKALDKGLSLALKRFPELRFMDTLQLCEIIKRQDPEWLSQSLITRVRIATLRLWASEHGRRLRVCSGYWLLRKIHLAARQRSTEQNMPQQS